MKGKEEGRGFSVGGKTCFAAYIRFKKQELILNYKHKP